jgi:hypothetical protein
MPSTNNKLKLFGYGSLNVEVLEGLTRTKIGRPKAAFIKNHVRIFAGYSEYWAGAVASIYPFQGPRVFGSVVELTEKEMAAIDEYEGIDPDSPDTGYYKRVKRAIYIRTGETYKKHFCFVYIKTDVAYEAAPSTRYINSIKTNLRAVGNEDKDPINVYGVVMAQEKPVVMQILKKDSKRSTSTSTSTKHREQKTHKDKPLQANTEHRDRNDKRNFNRQRQSPLEQQAVPKQRTIRR